MTPRASRKSPERIALLPDREAVKYLTMAVLQGKDDLPQTALEKACTPLGGPRWDAEPIRQLVDEAMARFATSPPSADAWMASRLHAELRITRREAANSGLWNFLAFRLAPDYVLWRHAGRPSAEGIVGPTNQRRFSGPFHTQTFARLWWAAELFRDASDYGPVELACGNQDILNTVLRLEIIHHRPTAQAVVRMLERGAVRTGREVNALAQAVNAAGSTLCFEVLAPDEPQDMDSFRTWLEDARSTYVLYDSLPDGPGEGGVPTQAVDTLTLLFEKLFSEAPVRGRGSSTGGQA